MFGLFIILIGTVIAKTASDSVNYFKEKEKDDVEWLGAFETPCFDNSRDECIHNDWFMLPHPSIADPYHPPFLPYSIGNEGTSIQSSAKISFEKDVIELSREIVEEINNPDVITMKQSLSKFNILVQLLKTASAEQMDSITAQLYVKISPSADQFHYKTWLVFRDAVIQAGTGPSIISLYKWTRDEYVYGEEAAQLVSTITNTAEFPTEEFMKTFFMIVENANNNERIYLNSSSVLAFSSLIKKVYVCKKSMVKRFPIYSFGKPTAKKSKALNSIYLPYLANNFYDSVIERDSHKIQIYIRALGNTAHPTILKIFSPYLSGKKELSNFQRLLMVSCLDSMAVVHPNLVRSVLYEIYLNSGEMPEIRTEAVALLMTTNPPTDMLQRMAEATNFDNSDHLNAAVKSGIESASQINTNDELSRNANEAVHLLKPKTYGLHYSYNYIRSSPSKENLGYKLRWNHIQSSGSIFPSSFFFILRPNLGGFTQRAYKFSWMSSSMDNLANLLADQIVQSNSRFHNEEGRRPLQNILNTLGIKAQQNLKMVEGNLYYTLHGARRFITIDKHTVKEFPRLVKYASSAYHIGDSLNYTKLYNQFSLKLAFPMVSGLPFIFTVEAPTIVSLTGDVRMNSYPDLGNGSTEKIRPPESLNLTADIQTLFSSKTESKIGFITPFNSKHYLAGYDTNVHVHLPLMIKADIDVSNNKIWTKLYPFNQNKYKKIAEFSTLAFTSRNNILTLSPAQLNDDIQIIRIKPVKETKLTLGHNTTGFAFDLKMESQNSLAEFPSIFNSIKQNDLLSSLMFFDKLSSVQPFTNYSICFNPNKSNNKFLKIVLNYADVKEYVESEENDDPQRNDAFPNVGINEHKKRVEQFLKRSTSGMRDSYAQAADLSFEFEGNSSITYSVTGAYARSHVSQKARYLLHFSKSNIKGSNSKPFVMALDLRGRVPNVPLGNFMEAIKSDPTSAVVARLNFGEKSTNGAEIVIKGQMEKSQERINYLLNQPISKACFKEMNESSYLLQACNNATTRANYMDHIYFRIDYQNVGDIWLKKCYELYSLLRYYSFPFISENILNQTNPNGRVEFEAVFSPELNSLNASLTTPDMSTELKNVRVNKYFQPALVMHPHYTVWDRIFERIIYNENTPRCAVDEAYAITFDNKTYPMFVGRHCWHVLLHFARASDDSLQWTINNTVNNYMDNVSVLIKGTGPKERELLLLLGGNVIQFSASSGSPAGYFIANDEHYDLSEELVGHFEDKSGKTLVQAFKLTTGNMRIFTPEHGLIIFYDGFRVEIQADSRYRGKVRGLCGTYDGERTTDFTTPKDCVVQSSQDFTSSYAVPDASCPEQTKNLHRKAQESPCFEQTIIPTKLFTYKQYKPHSLYMMSKVTNMHPKHQK